MDEQHDLRNEPRMQMMHRYSQALAVGDLETIAAALTLAENDPVLEAMLLLVDSLSEAQDGVNVPDHQLLAAQYFLRSLRAGTQDAASHELTISSKSPLTSVSKQHRNIREGRVQPMQQEPPPLPPNVGARRAPGSHGTRFTRAANFMRSAAAVLVVATLIVGFLLVLSLHSGMKHQTMQNSTETSTPHGIYFSRSDTVYRLDIQTRKVIWHTRVPGIGGPTVLGDTVYVSTYTAAKPGAEGSAMLYGLDANTGAIRWKDQFPDSVVGVFEDSGVTYILGQLPNHADALYVIHPASGKITATYTSSTGSWPGPPIGGYVYYLSASTASLDAVEFPSETLAWQQPLDYNLGSMEPGPIIVENGVVYLDFLQIYSQHGVGIIEAFNAHTGTRLWQTPYLPFGQRTDFATADMLYAGGRNVMAFNVHTHALVWTAPYDTYDIQSNSGVLYIECCTDAPQIVALDANSGKLIWHMQSKTLGLHLASIYNGVVYVIGWDDNGENGAIFAVDAATGQQLWTMPTEVPYIQWSGLVVA